VSFRFSLNELLQIAAFATAIHGVAIGLFFYTGHTYIAVQQSILLCLMRLSADYARQRLGSD